MISIFIRLCSAYTVSKYFTKEQTYTAFPSYGFDSGFLDYAVSGNLNKSGVNIKIKLIPIKEYRKIRQSLKQEACRVGGVASYSHTVSRESLTGTIAVSKKDVYVPVVGNCNGNTFRVEIVLRNKKSFLDFRDNNIAGNLWLLSAINVVFIAMWAYNALVNYRFFIRVHLYFGFAICLNLINLVIKMFDWKSKIVSDEHSVVRKLVISAFGVFSNSFLFTVNAAAIMGYGVYRDHIAFGDILSIFYICVLFFTMKIIIELIDDFLIWCPLLFVAMNVVFTYLDMINNGIISAFYLRSDFDDGNSPESKKFQLIIDFGRDFLTGLTTIMLIGALSILLESWQSTKLAWEQVYYCFVIISDLKYFLINEEIHKGSIVVEEEEKNENTLVYLKDPIEEHLVSISNNIDS